ncbi:YrhA family protein [Streptococcus fryi]
MWKQLIEEIRQIELTYDERLNAPISSLSFDVSPTVKSKEIKDFLKNDYLNFLSIANGIDFNGCLLYGIASVRGNSEKVYDIFEMNEIWHEVEEHRRYFFFGESNMSWFVFSLIDSKFYELDIPSGDIVEIYEDFNSILDNFFEQAMQ